MVIIATRNDCSSGYRKFAHGCKKSEAAENKRHGPKLPLLCLGFVLKFRFRCLHSTAPLLEADLIAPEPSPIDYDSVIRRFNGLPVFTTF